MSLGQSLVGIMCVLLFSLLTTFSMEHVFFLLQTISSLLYVTRKIGIHIQFFKNDSFVIEGELYCKLYIQNLFTFC